MSAPQYRGSILIKGILRNCLSTSFPAHLEKHTPPKIMCYLLKFHKLLWVFSIPSKEQHWENLLSTFIDFPRDILPTFLILKNPTTFWLTRLQFPFGPLEASILKHNLLVKHYRQFFCITEKIYSMVTL